MNTGNTAVRPIVIRAGRIGDMVMALPAIFGIAERHGAPCEIVGTGRFMAQLYAGIGAVAGCHVFPSKKTPYWLSAAKRRIAADLRGDGDSPVYVLEDSRPLERYGCRLGRLEHRPLSDIESGAGKNVRHWIDEMCAFARVPVSEPRLFVGEGEVAECADWYVGLNVGAPAPILLQVANEHTGRGAHAEQRRKYWQRDKWVRVINWLRQTNPSNPVLLIGSPTECYVTEDIASNVADAQVCSVAHDLPLRRLSALIQKARFMVSVDTGPAHMAAALQCPIVVLIDQFHPHQYGPRSAGAPVVHVIAEDFDPDDYTVGSWEDAHFQDMITVDQVIDACRTQGFDKNATP